MPSSRIHPGKRFKNIVEVTALYYGESVAYPTSRSVANVLPKGSISAISPSFPAVEHALGTDALTHDCRVVTTCQGHTEREHLVCFQRRPANEANRALLAICPGTPWQGDILVIKATAPFDGNYQSISSNEDRVYAEDAVKRLLPVLGHSLQSGTDFPEALYVTR